MPFHSLLYLHNIFTINKSQLVHQGHIQSPSSHINCRFAVCLMYDTYTDGGPGVFHVICFLPADDGWVRGVFAARWFGQREEAVREPGVRLVVLSVDGHSVSLRAEICSGENVVVCRGHEGDKEYYCQNVWINVVTSLFFQFYVMTTLCWWSG